MTGKRMLQDIKVPRLARLASLCVALVAVVVCLVPKPALATDPAFQGHASLWWRVEGTTLTLSAASAPGYAKTDLPLLSADQQPWKASRALITRVTVTDELAPMSCAYLFDGCSNLSQLDLANLDWSHVSSLRACFRGCSSLRSFALPASLPAADDLSYAFANSGLTSVTAPSSTCSLPLCTTMAGTFAGTRSLASFGCRTLVSPSLASLDGTFALSGISDLDLSGWDTHAVTTISGAFYGSSLTRAHLDGWDLTSLVDASSAFGACANLVDSGLAKPAARGLGTVESVAGIFDGCSSLPVSGMGITGVSLPSLAQAPRAFAGCSSVGSLDLSAWDANSLVDVTSMLDGCTALTQVNLSGLGTTGVGSDGMGSLDGLLANMPNLERLTLGEGFSLSGALSRRASLGLRQDRCWRSESDGRVYEEGSLPSQVADTYVACIPTSGVTLSIGSKTIFDNEGFSLVATVYPDDASDKSVTWSSSAESVATVSATGYVVGRGPGDAVITVTCNQGGWQALCYVHVNHYVEVTGVSVSPTSLTLNAGATGQLRATVAPANATERGVRWSSSNTGVATVDANGVVRAVKAGTARITVTTVRGSKTASCNVTVIDLVPVYRFYKASKGAHMYTISESERASLKSNGYTDEGIAWRAPRTSSAPVYRLANPSNNDHMFTTSTVERDSLIKAGWRSEGTGWYSDTAKTIPVYRVYNPNAEAFNHHFTLSVNERDSLVRAGWRNEGIAWYAAAR